MFLGFAIRDFDPAGVHLISNVAGLYDCGPTSGFIHVGGKLEEQMCQPQ